MSFELPSPKTRKEYFMAIAAGGVPGEDFPERYDLQPKTMEEAFYANLAQFDVSSALSTMSAKTRKDMYLLGMIDSLPESFPVPKTRKEYFMAIAAGCDPGTDFPERWERKPIYSSEEDSYEVTLSDGSGAGPYHYFSAINNFVDLQDMVVVINGKNAPLIDGKYKNEDGYFIYQTVDRQGNMYWEARVVSETELSGSALNVTIETSGYIIEDEGLPLMPKTMDEEFYAFFGDQHYYYGSLVFDLGMFPLKSRKDKYQQAIMENLY